ncbi:MAG: 23S rRNA (guanosine(2251)-2'-O)-methyltransferase RlmB [Arenicellales bacterium]|jgi:23S rRNA (guanosine2251-2'-O)-methyltransferase|nr:23S rRNA (guanosine(2251)-2'-O)-methyltransferase RlmB [Arenicellales bacterium]MDP6790293.1 23S rRNA (guanosine(2251)-2'-O)-methyltransferase RlmB [Arenicellales bacterium]|tara:strand:- start:92910 stop:93689 length:780 start_codon:yes stop_codon:yes gene_type:complete
MGTENMTLCGFHAVEAAIRADPVQISELVHDGNRKDQRINQLLSLARSRGVRVRRSDRAALDRLAGTVRHQGVVGLLPHAPAKGLSEFKEWRAQVNQETLILLLDGIEDPRNVGACLRTAAAAGVDGVIMPAKTGAGLTPAALRVAEGGIHQLNVFELESWTHVLKKLKEAGIWIIGTSGDADTSLYDFDLSGPLGFVVGSESSGVRQITRKQCDALVRIPAAGSLSSLNVSVATGVALFEAIRQRRVKTNSLEAPTSP